MSTLRRNLQLFLLFFLGGVGIFLFWLYESSTQEFFKTRSTISKEIDHLFHKELFLNYEVLKSSFFLYHSYDALTSIQKEIETLLQALASSKIITQDKKTKEVFERYNAIMQAKLNAVEEFKRYNAMIKTSVTYIITLLHKIPQNILQDRKKSRYVLNLIGDILFSKNSLDTDFLPSIKENIELLKPFATKKPTDFLSRLILHATLFERSFAQYKQTVDTIMDKKSLYTLQRLESALAEYFKYHHHKLQKLLHLLLFFYLVLLLMISYFIYRLHQENQRLEKLKTKFRHFSITDDLTGLYNRRAYKQDIRKYKKPFFALADIDSFKHYNDFYGNKVGDHILRQCAKLLQNHIPKKFDFRLYRLGADEFGILMEERDPIDADAFAKMILDIFKHDKIRFKNIDLSISVSIGMSRKRPLIETADMALRSAKNSPYKKYALFDPRSNYFTKIKENLERSKIIQEAIEQDNLLPFFQAIISNTTGAIVKYEALARIYVDGKYESIHPYLPLAKEMGLYPQITKTILAKSFQAVQKVQKPISINLAMNDIENPEILNYLGELLERHPQLTSFITFEILESETLKDYRAVQNFISILKAKGIQIAIDDFGSGYSNFAHIFNLDIDIIKIDGSLIQQLPTNPNAKKVVQTIHNLAKEFGIETVAEFVSDEKIFEEVKKIGIDYSQGYYLEKPKKLI